MYNIILPPINAGYESIVYNVYSIYPYIMGIYGQVKDVLCGDM